MIDSRPTYTRLFDADSAALQGVSIQAAGLWWFLLGRRRQLDHNIGRDDSEATDTRAAAEHFGLSIRTVQRYYRELVAALDAPTRRGAHGSRELKSSALLPPVDREANVLFRPSEKAKRPHKAKPPVTPPAAPVVENTVEKCKTTDPLRTAIDAERHPCRSESAQGDTRGAHRDTRVALPGGSERHGHSEDTQKGGRGSRAPQEALPRGTTEPTTDPEAGIPIAARSREWWEARRRDVLRQLGQSPPSMPLPEVGTTSSSTAPDPRSEVSEVEPPTMAQA